MCSQVLPYLKIWGGITSQAHRVRRATRCKKVAAPKASRHRDLCFHDTEHQRYTHTQDIYPCALAHVRRVVKRWSRAWLWRAFLRWQENVAEIKHMTSIALKTIARLNHSLPAQCWARWNSMVDYFLLDSSTINALLCLRFVFGVAV